MTARDRKAVAERLRELALLVENDLARVNLTIAPEVDVATVSKDGTAIDGVIVNRGRTWTVRAVTLR